MKFAASVQLEHPSRTGVLGQFGKQTVIFFCHRELLLLVFTETCAGATAFPWGMARILEVLGHCIDSPSLLIHTNKMLRVCTVYIYRLSIYIYIYC